MGILSLINVSIAMFYRAADNIAPITSAVPTCTLE